MLAFLGWNPGDAEEYLSLEQLVAKFSLDRVSKNGARFDPEKAKWFNHIHLANAPVEQLVPYLLAQQQGHGITITEERAAQAIKLVQERLTLLTDLWKETDYFWVAPASYEEKALKKHCNEQTPNYIEAMRTVVANCMPLEAETLESALKTHITENSLPMGKVMNALRLALVGESRGIDVATIMAFLGKEETLRRIDAFLAFLGNK